MVLVVVLGVVVEVVVLVVVVDVVVLGVVLVVVVEVVVLGVVVDVVVFVVVVLVVVVALVVVVMLVVGINVDMKRHLLIVFKVFLTVNGFIQKSLDIFKLSKVHIWAFMFLICNGKKYLKKSIYQFTF